MFPLSLGQINITANRLTFGDPDVPPPGAVVSGVPNGTFDVVAKTKDVHGETWVCAFRIMFEDGDGADVVEEGETFSIDSGVLCIADPDAPAIPRTWWRRRPVRRDFRHQIMRGVAEPHYIESFRDAGTGSPWALVFRIYADGVYRLSLRRSGGLIMRMDCTLI